MHEGREYQNKTTAVLFYGILAILAFSAFFGIAHAATGINHQINFQGKVVNNTAGTNVTNGNYDFVFKIYTVSSGGAAVWTETWNSGTSQVTVTDGIFQVNLGTHTALPGSIDFNTDNVYLGIEFNGDGEMSPRVRFTAVPQAFNAEKVAGLTVTNTTGTLTIPNGETISFGGSFTTSASNDVTLTTTGTTSVTLPTAGTLLTNTASANQTVTSTQTSGTVFGLTDSTALSAAIKGLSITLSGTGAFDQTGLEFNLSNASGSNLYDIVGSGSKWKVDTNGNVTLQNQADLRLGDSDGTNYVAFQAPGTVGTNVTWTLPSADGSGCFQSNGSGTVSIASCGGGSSDLQTAYGNDTDTGNTTISLTTADDSLIFTNPTSSGTDSTFLLYLNQQHTTGVVSVLDIAQASNAANAVNLTANSIDGETGLDIVMNGLTSGKGISVASSATAFTGNLIDVTLSGSHANNTGALLMLNNTGTSNANTSLYVKHYATGTNNLALRVDDVSGDTTPFVIDGSGQVGIGTTAPTAKLEVVGDIVSKGTEWTARSAAGNDDSWYDVTYGNGLFVAVGDFGNRVMTSPDGINWTTRTAAGDNDNWHGVTYGNGLFVAVGTSGDRVMTSPDGINWTTRTAAGDNDNWHGVTYGNGLFVAVGTSGDRVMTSPDGVTWTAQSAAGDNDSWRGVTYGNGLFVAVGTSGDRVMTSPDGVTWTAQSVVGDDDDWQRVTYGNGLFVAVGTSGDRVMTSPDGVTWTAQSAAGDNDSWRGVTYGNGLFVAVSSSGDRVMTSPDGAAWTVRTAAGNDDNWYGVTYGNGRFVAVGNTGDRIITSGQLESTVLAHNNIYQGGMGIFGNVGIGTAAPTTSLELYSSAAADNIFTLTSATATNDPLIKLRSGSTPGIQFTLGLDTSDTNTFKIRQGDGFSTTDTFTISSLGTTSILDARLGAQKFEEDAGAVSWVDMNVSTSPAAGTIMSYSAQIDAMSMLTVYAEADGSGGLQNKRIQVGGGGSGSTTPAVLGLDVKSTTGDPSGFEGAMYYNTYDNKFRCYQNSGWTDCIGSGGSGGTPTVVRNTFSGTTGLTTSEQSIVSVSITPSSSANEIYVMGVLNVDSNTTSDRVVTQRLRRGSSCATGTQFGVDILNFTTNSTEYGVATGAGVDSPNTTSATTYHLCVVSTGTSIDAIAASIVVMEVNLGADLAEIYNTNDSTLQPGDVVSIDRKLGAGVRKSTQPYDQNAFGIVSTHPALLIGGGDRSGVTAVPVALSGRVPIKVSTENGSIHVGDPLTTASIPGSAMKATKAGKIIGIALEGYDDSKIGIIMAFAKTDQYTGGNLEKILSDTNKRSLSSADTGKEALRYFLDNADVIMNNKQVSEVLTDRVSAGLEMITPKLMTHEIATDRIGSGLTSDVAFMLDDNGQVTFGTGAKDSRIVFDSAGNGTFTGTLTVGSLVAGDIPGLSAVTDHVRALEITQEELADKLALAEERLATLESSTDQTEPEPDVSIEDTMDVSGNNSSLDMAPLLTDQLPRISDMSESPFLSGGLTVVGDVRIEGESWFGRLATFFGEVIFQEQVAFEKAPTFGNDTAGMALIKKGQKTVRIDFDEPYAKTPVVSATIARETNPLLSEAADPAMVQDIQMTEDNFVQNYFMSGAKYVVTDKDESGFVIRLDKPAEENLVFDWIALSVPSAQVSESQDGTDVSQAELPVQGTAPVIPEVLGVSDDPADSSVAVPEGTTP